MVQFPQPNGPFVRVPDTKATTDPLPYTGTPWKIFHGDIRLFLVEFFYLPFIFLPLTPALSGPLDELYPSRANLIDIAYHVFLSFTQLGFIVSLFFLSFLPAWAYFAYIAVMFIINELICRHFNSGIPSDGLRSTEDDVTRQWEKHDDEEWIFLNGICVG